MLWGYIAYVFSFFTLSPIREPGSEQQTPLMYNLNIGHQALPKGPIFKPPTSSLKGPGSDFKCDYSAM